MVFLSFKQATVSVCNPVVLLVLLCTCNSCFTDYEINNKNELIVARLQACSCCAGFRSSQSTSSTLSAFATICLTRTPSVRSIRFSFRSSSGSAT